MWLFHVCIVKVEKQQRVFYAVDPSVAVNSIENINTFMETLSRRIQYNVHRSSRNIR